MVEASAKAVEHWKTLPKVSESHWLFFFVSPLKRNSKLVYILSFRPDLKYSL